MLICRICRYCTSSAVFKQLHLCDGNYGIFEFKSVLLCDQLNVMLMHDCDKDVVSAQQGLLQKAHVRICTVHTTIIQAHNYECTLSLSVLYPACMMLSTASN